MAFPMIYRAFYASRLFNPEFLRAKDLAVPGWLEGAELVWPPGVLQS